MWIFEPALDLITLPCILSVRTMAPPTATETATTTETSSFTINAVEAPALPTTGRVEPDGVYRFDHLLPTFDANEKYPPLQPYEHDEPGLRALQHPNPQAFLVGAKTVQLTPAIGAEVDGIDLLKLTKDQKDELALAVAKNKVVVLRNQQHVRIYLDGL